MEKFASEHVVPGYTCASVGVPGAHWPAQASIVLHGHRVISAKKWGFPDGL